MSFLFVDKPSGATTHTSHGGGERVLGVDPNDGFVEYLSARSRQDLLVTHRLDRDTTGALCFARTAEAAEGLRKAFSAREVTKRYLFLTEQTATESSSQSDPFLTASSFIERRGSSIVSEPATAAQPANALTRLRKLDESDGLALWEARPETGKSHQIRLHAKQLGIEILGDTLYGGAPYPALCLHSEHIQFRWQDADLIFATPPPRWFFKRNLCTDRLLARWLAAVDRRERLLRSWRATGETIESSTLTLRWIHKEGDPLRVEQLGDVVSLSWFSDTAPTTEEMQSIERLTNELGWNQWHLRLRRDQGQSRSQSRSQSRNQSQRGGRRQPPEKETESNWKSTPPPPDQWSAQENGLTFQFRSEQGLSPGLFLDQRRNRAWIRANVAGKTVLNLFCYTGAFSVAATAGDAIKVVSVDLSRVFLDWAKTNFSLNNLPLTPHEFRAIDSRTYLKWAAKKGLRFDLVICDPPSFSRSDDGIFKINVDVHELISDLIKVTTPGGRILFATNYEGWSESQFILQIQASVAAHGTLSPTPSQDWDFELPKATTSRRESGSSRNMKSVFIDTQVSEL